MNKQIRLSVPDTPRIFTQAENTYMANFPFRGKTYAKASRQAKEYMATLVSIIETNPRDQRGYVHIPMAYLGKLFKSVQMAEYVVSCARKGVVTSDNHYNADMGISKGYRLTDGFKLTNICSRLRERRAKEELSDSKTLEWQPLELMQQESEPKQEDEPSAAQLEIVRELIARYNTQFNRNRYSAADIDPLQNQKCSCCENELPSYMFSLSKNNTMNDKCRICWDLKIDENETLFETCMEVMRLFKRKTPTQRSIRKLKESREVA